MSRTPEEDEELARDYCHVADVLSATFNSYVSWIVADKIGESDEICDDWLERTWWRLDTELTKEQLIYTIINSMRRSAEKEARKIIKNLRSVPTTS